MPAAVRSLVPARIDRLPWASFHTRMVVALGVAWVLDGLEITIASAIGPILQRPDTLGLAAAEVGFAATVYLAGEVTGALYFGWLSDRLGRRRLFVLTLGIYLTASGLTAVSWGYASFLFFRFAAGAGIGGEYAAINSAIDEMIPAAYRGHADLAINGTYWLGAILGTLTTAILLAPDLLPPDVSWRLGLLLGPAIGLAIWRLRSHLPESPRWLLTHDRVAEAEAAVAEIERDVAASGLALPPIDPGREIEIVPESRTPLTEVARTLFVRYPSRSVLAASLLVTQSFLYNAIFFTYTLVLVRFYGVAEHDAPKFLLAFAAGNLAGPFLLGRLFDTVGRRRMIAGTYLASGLLLAVTAWLFDQGLLTATTQTILWSVIFFVASAAASSAYLTASEIFPIELRAQAISFFFAIGQIVGATGPVLFGWLVGDEANPDPTGLFFGYLAGAGFMIAGGLIEAFLGVDAERRSLEEVAAPLGLRREARGEAARV